MSAFMVAKSHIDAILSAVRAASQNSQLLYVNCKGALFTYDCYSPKGLTELGRILWAANLESVLFRYPSDTPDSHEDVTGYTFRHQGVTMVQGLKLLQSLDYQCCEPDDWHSTLGRAVIVAIMEVLVRKLPGYEDAPWAMESA